jgi:uncharacterized membrane protein
VSSFLASTAGRWILLVSLALNLALLIALLLPRVGLGLAAGEPATRRGGGGAGPVPWVIRSVFEGDRREQVTAIMQDHREPIRAVLREVRRARRDVGAALHADPFEPASLEQALEHLRRAEAAASIAMHHMLADVVEDLDGSERAAVAERLWSTARPDRTRRGTSDWRERREARDALEREEDAARRARDRVPAG